MRMEEHKLLWKHNEALLLKLKQNCNSHYDWIIIITFYASLHKMAILIHFKDPKFDTRYNYMDHQHFNKLVHKYFKDIFSKYHDLYRESRKLRYFQTRLNAISEQKLDKFLDIWFNTIKPLKPYPTS